MFLQAPVEFSNQLNRRFTNKTLQKLHHVIFPSVNSAIITWVKVGLKCEYLSQRVFSSDDSERLNLSNSTEERLSWISIVEKYDIAMTTYLADNGVLHCNE